MFRILGDAPDALRLAEKRASYFAKPEPTAHMGKIITAITVTNYADHVFASRGLLSEGEVRSIELASVVADTGATLLCLPRNVIDKLGLEFEREVFVATATGANYARIYSGARITLLDRTITQDCLELPGGTDPLLGALPMEALGVQLDLQNQSLRLLPMDDMDTFYTIY
jgi:predicted aspartyl protease